MKIQHEQDSDKYEHTVAQQDPEQNFLHNIQIGSRSTLDAKSNLKKNKTLYMNFGESRPIPHELLFIQK